MNRKSFCLIDRAGRDEEDSTKNKKKRNKMWKSQIS